MCKDVVLLRYSKVIFVSTSGNCRCILSKAIFNNLKSDMDIYAEARGKVVLFEEPANPKAVAIAKSKGISIEDETSKQLSNEDFGEDVLVLVMTDLLKKEIYEEYESAINVYSIREFALEAVDVEVTYGGELVDYGELYEHIENLVTKVIVRIKEMEEETEEKL